MINELKFVQGAICKKGFTPELSHFKIRDGQIQSYNGALSLSSPIEFDIDCNPKAIPFVKAIQNCKTTVSMSLTKAGKLSIKSGSFRAYVECFPVEEEALHITPEGDFFDIDGEALLNAFKTLQPFIATDASKPWSNGILLRDGSAYATNNVTLIEYWIGGAFPHICNIPRDAVREIVRIGKPPTGAMSTGKTISFLYEDDKWVKCQLLTTEWPDVSALLNASVGNAEEISDEFFEGLLTLKPFVDAAGRVFFKGGVMRTSLINKDGASYGLDGMNTEGVYRLEMVLLLRGVAQKIDFSLYPKPCIFYGDRLRGVLIGMRT
jgi:DNA polymerase III sliding clamp (beta) subunit (PCNA family)